LDYYSNDLSASIILQRPSYGTVQPISL